MFITYIITLVKDGDYLQRCIESLYAQKNNDFEIIIADFNVGSAEKYIEEQLDQRDNLKIIDFCDKEAKLLAATQLIDKSTQFVQFIEETFFATPYAIEHLRDKVMDDVQLLLPNIVTQSNDAFIKKFTDNWEDVEISGNLNAFSYCFRKDLFELYSDGLIRDPYNIESVLDVILSKGTERAYIDQICYYVVETAVTRDIAEVADYDNIKLISENITGEKISSMQVKLFIKYVQRLISIINSENSTYDDKCMAYETLKQFGKITMSNHILNRFFMSNVGISYQDIENLELSGFLIIYNDSCQRTDIDYISTVVAKSIERSYLRHENSLHSIELNIAATNRDNKLKNESFTEDISEMTAELRLIKQQLENHKTMTNVSLTAYDSEDGIPDSSKSSYEIEKIEKMHEDIVSMSTNMHILMQRFGNGDVKGISDSKISGFLEPVNEVPYLFATGKLGLKVLIKSFNCWFRFKFSRKKK